MCFYNDDYVWIARVVDVDRMAVSDKPVVCDECNRKIPAGTQYVHVHMEENDPDDWDEQEAIEEAWDGLEDDFVGPPDPPVFSPGETFDYDRCRECDLMLLAIEASELESGCHQNNARPPLEQLSEVMHDDRRDEGRYLAKARVMFPELESSGYLAVIAGSDEEASK